MTALPTQYLNTFKGAAGDMADRNALGLIGLMLGAATMFVVSVGAVVVADHMSGRLTLVDSMQAMRTVALSSKAQ